MTTRPSVRLFALHRRWRVLLAAGVAARTLFALNPAEKPANYLASHGGTEDGLPHNSGKQLFQTSDGYLWIGTSQGLARVDGIAFAIFTTHNTPAISGSIITARAATRDGSFWIGTSSGLVRYLDGRFTGFGQRDGLKSDTVSASSPTGSPPAPRATASACTPPPAPRRK